MTILVKHENENVRLNCPFVKSYEGDAGFDLYNASNSTVTIKPYHSTLISAGIKIKLPDGYCGIIMGRSSTFSKRGILVVQGLIDCDYTGEIFTVAYNPCLDGKEMPVIVNPWERISQMVIHAIPDLHAVELYEEMELPTTKRGEKGFGSSGL